MLSITVSRICSLLLGLSMLLGSFFGLSSVGNPGPVQRSGAAVSTTQKDPQRMKRWPFQGDKVVREGLILAAISATGLQPVQVWEALDRGSSVTEIAASAGKTEEDVLDVFDESIQALVDRWVEKGRLPESLVQERVGWYEGAARQMIRQPRLTPAYPGLHELHFVAITAAIRTTGMSRRQIKDELLTCRTLNGILTEKGSSAGEAVETGMKSLRSRLDGLVQRGKLDEAGRQIWEAGIQSALASLMDVPGMHVAGKACAHS